MNIRELMTRLAQDVRGTSAVEYGMLLVMVALTILAALSGVADQTAGFWNDISTKSAEAHKAAGP